MSEKPRNKWFRGDDTAKRAESIDRCIVFYRREAGQPVFVSHNDSNWLECWEYAIVPVENLNLDIEEPEPELVQVMGCTAPTVQESSAIPGWAVSALYGDRGVRVLLVFHPDKNAAIEAHNAAAEVLNKHGGV